jgi:transcriptional regulator with XRE-family HTH domain
MEIQERIGLNVRRARLAANLSQWDLVAKLEAMFDDHGVDQGYISRLENGQHNPTALTLWRIAQALGVTMAQLVTEP